MMGLEIELDSKDKEAYKKLEEFAQAFVAELREKEPELESKITTWYNPNQVKLSREVGEPERIEAETVFARGEVIKKLRESKGLSRKWLAASLGVSSEYIRLIELGKRIPSAPMEFGLHRELGEF